MLSTSSIKSVNAKAGVNVNDTNKRLTYIEHDFRKSKNFVSKKQETTFTFKDAKDGYIDSLVSKYSKMNFGVHKVSNTTISFVTYDDNVDEPPLHMIGSYCGKGYEGDRNMNSITNDTNQVFTDKLLEEFNALDIKVTRVAENRVTFYDNDNDDDVVYKTTTSYYENEYTWKEICDLERLLRVASERRAVMQTWW